MSDVKKYTPPAMDLKHLIWILDWALAHCSDEIKRMEQEHVRNNAFMAFPAYTRYGYKERGEQNVGLALRLREYHDIYDWLIGAKEQATVATAEEFGRAMAEMFGKRKK